MAAVLAGCAGGLALPRQQDVYALLATLAYSMIASTPDVFTYLPAVDRDIAESLNWGMLLSREAYARVCQSLCLKWLKLTRARYTGICIRCRSISCSCVCWRSGGRLQPPTC